MSDTFEVDNKGLFIERAFVEQSSLDIGASETVFNIPLEALPDQISTKSAVDERRLVCRIDLHVIHMLCLIYVAAFLDRWAYLERQKGIADDPIRIGSISPTRLQWVCLRNLVWKENSQTLR